MNYFWKTALAVMAFILMTSPVLAVERLTIEWKGKSKTGDVYTIEVLSLSGGRPPTDPYILEITKSRLNAIGVGDNARVCVIPHEGSRPLGDSWLVLSDGRGYPLTSDETGKLCTPNNVSVGSDKVESLRIIIIR